MASRRWSVNCKPSGDTDQSSARPVLFEIPVPSGAVPTSESDLAIVDADARWTVPAEGRFSRGASVPFVGASLPGRVRFTILAGRVVARDGAPAEKPSGVWLRRGAAT
jgi:dihydroorotase-like cyclic amidohydrolase